MDIKGIKKHLSVGHLKKSFIVFLILIIFLCIGGPALYYCISFMAPKPQQKVWANNSDSGIAQDMIKKLSQQKGGLWFANYIWIDGKQYQLKYAKDGSIKVLKNGRLVPIDKAANNRSAIVNKDGKMYLYTTDGRLLDLASGDILATDEGVIEVSGNSVKPLNNDELISQNHKLTYVNPMTAETHEIKPSEVIEINGKAMKLVDGVLKPLVNKSIDTPDGKYISKDAKYYLKKNGALIPVDTQSLKDGDIVYLDGKPMVFYNGQLYSQDQFNTGVLTIADLDKILIGDYVLRLGSNGYPAYYVKRLHNLDSIQRSSIPDYALVYFQNKIYQKLNTKLDRFKAEVGEPFIKVDKPFTITKDLSILMLKPGDMIKYEGITLIVNDQGRFIVVDQTLAQNLKKYPNRLIIIDGEQKLYGMNGDVSDLVNNSLVFRNGIPYKYIDGKWVKLTPKEIHELQHPQATKVDKKKTTKPIEDQKTSKDQTKSVPTKQPTKESHFFETDKQDDNAYFDQLVAISQSSIQSNGMVDNSAFDITKAKPSITNFSHEIVPNNSNIIDNFTQSQTDYNKQNAQDTKQAFLQNQSKGKLGYFKYARSPFYLTTGTVINATMITSINSDLPGHIEAIVNTNVYDSASHNYVLIPAGTIVWGVYSSQVSYGQKRVLIAWNKLIFPNADEMDLAGQQGYDLTGQDGLTGDVDNHYWELFKNVGMLSLFSTATNISSGIASGGDGLNGLSLLAASIGQNLSNVGTQLIQKIMNVQPVIQIVQGTKFKILIDSSIEFPSPYINQQAVNAVMH